MHEGVCYPVDDVGIVARAGEIRFLIPMDYKFNGNMMPWARAGLIRWWERVTSRVLNSFGKAA